MRRAGAPAIRVLLRIFVAEHLFKASPLVIQLDHLVGPQALDGSCSQKELVDKWTNQFACGHLCGTRGSNLPRDDHAAGQREIRHRLQPIRDVAHVEELAPHLRFGMLHVHVTRVFQACLDSRMVEQMVVAPACHKAQSGMLDTGKG